MVLVAVQEVLSESKEKSQSAQRWPRRRMGRRSSGGAVAVVLRSLVQERRGEGSIVGPRV
jgi:hypothetical protein